MRMRACRPPQDPPEVRAHVIQIATTCAFEQCTITSSCIIMRHYYRGRLTYHASRYLMSLNDSFSSSFTCSCGDNAIHSQKGGSGYYYYYYYYYPHPCAVQWRGCRRSHVWIAMTMQLFEHDSRFMKWPASNDRWTTN